MMKLPRKAQAVVFDMDGLIFNTEELYRDATMAAAQDGGHQSDQHQLVKKEMRDHGKTPS